MSIAGFEETGVMPTERLATPWRRITSNLVDILVFGMLSAIITIGVLFSAIALTATLEGADSERRAQLLETVVPAADVAWLAVVALIQFPVQIFGNSTGLRLMGIATVNSAGRRPGWKCGVTRAAVIILGWTAIEFSVVAMLIYPSLLALWLWKRRAPCDLAAGTWVVRRTQPAPASTVPIRRRSPSTM